MKFQMTTTSTEIIRGYRVNLMRSAERYKGSDQEADPRTKRGFWLAIQRDSPAILNFEDINTYVHIFNATFSI